jgi:transposase
MSKKLYLVTLTAEERSHLRALVSKGKVAAHKRLHAQVLLKSDISPQGKGATDEEIAEALEINRSTVERVRRRFVEEGLQASLNRKKQKNWKARKSDGDTEAYLVALACSKPPAGRNLWTLKLLADHLVELELVDRVCRETVRQTLKKMNLNLG